MANVSAPFGFKPIRQLGGAAWSGNLTQRKVANADTTAIFKGDVVKAVNTGYVTQGAAGNTAHTNIGIFYGCEYLNTALGYRVWSNSWPGTGATGDIDCWIIDDPYVVFEVQASAGPIAFADIGINGDFVVTAGNTSSGMSAFTLNSATLATTATFPFRIVGLATGVGNGTDATTALNLVEVTWNDQFYKQTAGL